MRTFTNCLIRRSAWDGIHFNEEGGYGYAPYAVTMLELANRKRNLAMYRGAYKKFGYVNTAGRPKKEIPEEETKEFYTEELEKNYLPALQWVMERDQETQGMYSITSLVNCAEDLNITGQQRIKAVTGRKAAGVQGSLQKYTEIH